MTVVRQETQQQAKTIALGLARFCGSFRTALLRETPLLALVARQCQSVTPQAIPHNAAAAPMTAMLPTNRWPHLMAGSALSLFVRLGLVYSTSEQNTPFELTCENEGGISCIDEICRHVVKTGVLVTQLTSCAPIVALAPGNRWAAPGPHAYRISLSANIPHDATAALMELCTNDRGAARQPVRGTRPLCVSQIGDCIQHV